jgi:thymidylate kinase
MSTTAAEFIDLYFGKLEELRIPYVIIHSYQTLPQDVASDIDYAVRDLDLPFLTAILKELGRQHNWAVVQSFQHGVFAYYNVLSSLDDPSQRLLLDACSNYARARRLLVPNEVLLEGRRRYGPYWVPQPRAEFIYEATKLFDAKKKDPAKYLPKLRTLWKQDKEGAENLFNRAFGDTGRTLEDWLKQPPEEWHRLRELMLGRNRFGSWLLVRESIRVLKRVLHPTGLQITLLGPDGSGKSTLIELMHENLGVFFRRSKFYHFRPMFFEFPSDSKTVTEPHGKPAYGMARSVAKLLYYFLDHWAEYLLKVVSLKVRSTMIIFDRDFDDILIDSRRYRLSSSSIPLARFLRKLLPKSEVTFILDIDPVNCHARKPELPVSELERQRMELRALAASDSRYHLVDADRPAKEVAASVCERVVGLLLQRQVVKQ